MQAPYLRYQFKVLKENFNYKKIYLTEFGFAEPFSYLRQDLYQILYDTVSCMFFHANEQCLKYSSWIGPYCLLPRLSGSVHVGHQGGWVSNFRQVFEHLADAIIAAFRLRAFLRK